MEKAKRNELRALGKAATKAPWARAPKGTGAIYIHAVYVGTEKRHGREFMTEKRKPIGKLYDGYDGALPHRPENGKQNAELIVVMRNALPSLLDYCDALEARLVGGPMKNEDLADEIIARLNKLIENPQVREDLVRLIETRIPCTRATLDHPTIQASQPEKVPGLCECGAYGPPTSGWCAICNPEPQFGFLGLLNGLVGIIPDGQQKGWGYITAAFDDAGKLEGFRRTDRTDQ